MDQAKMGKLIAEIRKEKGMTQDELGELLGVNGKAVSKLECGINLPDISLLNNLSDILEVEIKDLLNGRKSLDKNEEERLKVAEEKLREKNRKRKNKIVGTILIVLISIYSIFLILVTKNLITNEFKTIRFTSSNINYVISGEIVATLEGKIIIVKDLKYQGENKGTDKEPLVKSAQLFIKKEKEVLFNYNFDEIKDDLGKVQYYYLSDIIENIPENVSELGKIKFMKNEKLTFNLTYINENDEKISEEINLDVYF